MLRRAAVSMALLLGIAASGQSPYIIHDNVNLVLLDVGVRDRRGGYIAGLSQNNFAIYDDRIRQKITQFTPIDAPVTIGLIVDNSGSMQRKRTDVVTAGLEFARSSNSQDEFFVVNFNDRVYFGLPHGVDFTDQLQILRSALFLGIPSGQTALYDAIAAGLKHLEAGSHPVRTLIVVSDGGDNVSKTSFDDVTRFIEASRATIYTVGLLDPDDRDINLRVLRKIALISGGEFFAPERLDQLKGIFEGISKDIRSRYSIGFVPDQSSDQHVVHTLKVVGRDQQGRKLIVHSRTTYVMTQ
jgi:Ca-activated chloride channel family protein